MENKEFKLGDFISKSRKDRGWTQKELADKLNVTDKAIYKWESNNGLPSIEFFPKLAELFDVSIDFLVTGHVKEEKVVTMSKIEKCAKDDDVELYKKIIKEKSIFVKDEDNISLLEYIFKYKSKNIFEHFSANVMNCLSSRECPEKINIDGEYRRTEILTMKMACETGNVCFLKNMKFKKYIVVDNKEFSKYQLHMLMDELYYIFSSKISDVVWKYLIDITGVDEISIEGCCKNYDNCMFLTYLVDILYKEKNVKMLETALKNLNTINKKILEIKEKATEYFSNRFTDERVFYNKVQLYLRIDDVGCQNILYTPYILEDTIKFALTNLDFDIVKKFNEVNEVLKDNVEANVYIANDYDFYKQEVLNMEISVKEKTKLLCIHGDVVSIDDLIAINDYKFYEECLEKYYVCEEELLYKKLKEKNFEFINIYARNNKLDSIIKSLKDSNHLEKSIRNLLKETLNSKINKKYIDYYVTVRKMNDVVVREVSYENLIKAKHFLFLLDVLDKDLKFVEKACKFAEQEHLDKALISIKPTNFRGIKILLDNGAKLHKVWSEDDGWGFVVTRDEIDYIGTELLKENIERELNNCK